MQMTVVGKGHNSKIRRHAVLAQGQSTDTASFIFSVSRLDCGNPTLQSQEGRGVSIYSQEAVPSEPSQNDAGPTTRCFPRNH